MAHAEITRLKAMMSETVVMVSSEHAPRARRDGDNLKMV